MHDRRFDVLFEPVRLGPVQTKNRFVQVPHCNGMGYRDPTAQAQMRRIKAEGGWSVICTEQVEIHPTSDITPFIELRLWDDGDIPALARIAEAIHDGGALAAIELAHNGMNAPNLTSREAPLGPHHLPVTTWANDPVQARMMSKSDIAELRGWHRAAVRRAIRAGYDVVYVYAGHTLSVLHHFLSPRFNHRSDEYGGSSENRSRLLAEILADTREECEGRAAVVCRLTVADDREGGIGRGDTEDAVARLDHLTDAWDFVLGTWESDSTTSRFSAENEREPLIAGLKALSAKPVIGVGRFTSPDTMVAQVRSGVLDLIGAARPSIADPFLPWKIEHGLVDDIRECIGCNICVSGDMTMSPIRCTQNPSMGEEWRRGWHPERIRPKTSDASVLVVGAGPAGLEAASSLGRRGYRVVLAEAGRTLGGRVAREAMLPSLATWRRVVDHRLFRISGYPHVEVYRESEIEPDDVLGADVTDVVVATGATWRADGVGRWHAAPVPIDPGAVVLTPDDLFGPAVDHLGRERRIVVFDDDHYYLGGVVAELLAGRGHRVRLVTPAPLASAWTAHTLEIDAIQRRLLLAGVDVAPSRAVVAVGAGAVRTCCVFTGREQTEEADAVVLVTARLPVDGLVAGLEARRSEWSGHGIRSVRCIGDAWAPGTIAAAVWAGRRYAEEFDEQPSDAEPFRREYTALAPYSRVP
ncbi:MAG: FAD-dependent oxidoreductase [Actinomycetota bacterium]|nr:FAD-dependent oxidoreductase [Actinomycetota bacterium]